MLQLHTQIPILETGVNTFPFKNIVPQQTGYVSIYNLFQ